jgi:ABC-2 type transport system permease protein
MVHPSTTESSAEVASPRPALAVWMLCWREVIRFVRQRNRIMGAILQPILFWLLFGAGMSQSFRMGGAEQGGQSFTEYYFPGTLVLIILFTAIFATVSVIEDRREGFLQSVLVAPIPRWSMVLGKVLGGSIVALFQGMIFLVLALTISIKLSLVSVLLIVLLVAVMSIGLTSFGLLLAWRMESTQGFHAVMNLILMPMWLLSGAFFPVPQLGAGVSLVQVGLHWAMRLNPLTYSVAALRRLIYWDTPELAASLELPSLTFCWLVSIVFAALAFGAVWKISGSRTTGDLL